MEHNDVENNSYSRDPSNNSLLINKYKSIKTLTIFDIVLSIIGFILFIVYFALFISKLNNLNNQHPGWDDPNFGNSVAKDTFNFLWVGVAIIIIAVLFLVASGIIQITTSIKILSTDWKNNKLNEEKTIWGILGLVILGWIANLVFLSKLKNNL